MKDPKEKANSVYSESNTALASFFALLLEVDRRVRPDLYTRFPVVGSDSKQEDKKETLVV